MTVQEFNEIKALLIGLGGVSKHISTLKRIDNAIVVLERDKSLIVKK